MVVLPSGSTEIFPPHTQWDWPPGMVVLPRGSTEIIPPHSDWARHPEMVALPRGSTEIIRPHGSTENSLRGRPHSLRSRPCRPRLSYPRRTPVRCFRCSPDVRRPPGRCSFPVVVRCSFPAVRCGKIPPPPQQRPPRRPPTFPRRGPGPPRAVGRCRPPCRRGKYWLLSTIPGLRG